MYVQMYKFVTNSHLTHAYKYIYNVDMQIHLEHNPYYHMACVSGQAGVFTAIDGLQLAYLSGRYSEQDYTVSAENKPLVGVDIL